MNRGRLYRQLDGLTRYFLYTPPNFVFREHENLPNNLITIDKEQQKNPQKTNSSGWYM